MATNHKTGSCQCGASKYAVDADPFIAYTCHCKDCQRLTSSAFATCMQVPAESVTITGGYPSANKRLADSGNEIVTTVCRSCGSPLFSQNVARPAIRTVYVGTLDEAEAIDVRAHIWTERKLPWVILPPDHRIYPRAGDWTADYANDMARYKPDETDDVDAASA